MRENFASLLERTPVSSCLHGQYSTKPSKDTVGSLLRRYVDVGLYRAGVLLICMDIISSIHTRSKFYVEGCMLLRWELLFEVDGGRDVVSAIDARKGCRKEKMASGSS